VLDAVFPFFRWAFEVEDGVHNAPLFEQGTHDGVGGLGLEDAAVVHQAQAPQGRLDHHFVAGAAVAGVAPHKFVHHASEPAQGLAILPHHQVYRLFQYISGGHIRVGAGQLQPAMEQIRQPFGQREADNDKVIRGEFAYTGGELQSACLGHDFDP
jgi:hypothetical protein